MDSLTISDLWIASAITVVTGLEPTYASKNKKIVFNFPATPEAREAVNAFTGGELQVSASGYSEVVRRLRNEMMTRRNLI